MASPRKKMKISESIQDSFRKVNAQNGNNADPNLIGSKQKKDGRQTSRQSSDLSYRKRVSVSVQVPVQVSIVAKFRAKLMRKKSKRKKKKDNRKGDSDPSEDLPNLHMEEIFEQSPFFQEFKGIFESFDTTTKLCLSCVAVFPENAVVKKRVLVHWWVGEGILDKLVTEKGRSVEEIASDFLKEFVDKKFIYSVKKKGRKVMNSFKMHPLVRSAVITLAQGDGLFGCILEVKPTTNFPGCRRVFLVDTAEGSSLPQPRNSPNNQGKLETLFNVSYQFPDFTFEQFKKMREIKVLYMGRWQSSADSAVQSHIEVGSTEFLKGLKYMKDLRLFSLQGISGIPEIPSSIKKLKNLRILDLKACYNLEKLPKELGSLKRLSHLDISGCYLMDNLPKELSLLSQLQVLKGFVIGDPRSGNYCPHSELTKLEKLRKLSINVNSENFSIEDLSTTLFKFKQLIKLKIAWGGGSSPAKSKQGNEGNNQVDNKKDSVSGEPKAMATKQPDKRGDDQRTANAASNFRRSVNKLVNVKRLFSKRSREEPKNKIEKLDLQCFPYETLPSWLTPQRLKNLKKLYIRGGRLKSLDKSGAGHVTWKIAHLRLKYLHELHMNWRELQELFPELQYLENFKCPNVTFCPCDGRGVWRGRTTEANSL